MKKITLLFTCLAMSLYIFPQQTISFESSEGYTTGNINAQNSWETTGDGGGGFITNQVVSNEQATNGTISLKIDKEPAFGGQSSPFVGAFYNYATAVPYANAVFSADMYIDTFDSANTSDYLFGLVNTTAGSFITYIRFTFEGNISVLVDDGIGGVTVEDTTIDWTPLTWFNVRMELNNNSIEFFIDNVSIYQGTVATTNTDIEQIRFAHDNYAGFAHVDNFRTNDEPLSVNEFDKSTITHHYNKDSKTLNLKSSDLPISGIEVYSILGQNVISKSLNHTNESLNVSSLNDGVYLVKININGNSKTIRFVKN
ncbi:hypothetical protein FBALC1_14382 [Flavobacteriales bacterium ALC-1]|nr:hypothetical protein FBALC1_14382 [Flavobacteriales bacterium ALC-1]